MIKFICDKCGEELGPKSSFVVYSSSLNRMVNLCSRCQIEHSKAIKKADEDFFKTEDKT